MRYLVMTAAVLALAATSHAQGAQASYAFDACGFVLDSAFEMQAPRQCEIPGYPTPPDLGSVGLSWCGSNIDFQRRAFALQAAGIWCEVLAGRVDRSAAREPVQLLCDRLDALARGGRACRCPAGYIP